MGTASRYGVGWILGLVYSCVVLNWACGGLGWGTGGGALGIKVFRKRNAVQMVWVMEEWMERRAIPALAQAPGWGKLISVAESSLSSVRTLCCLPAPLLLSSHPVPVVLHAKGAFWWHNSVIKFQAVGESELCSCPCPLLTSWADGGSRRFCPTLPLQQWAGYRKHRGWLRFNYH